MNCSKERHRIFTEFVLGLVTAQSGKHWTAVTLTLRQAAPRPDGTLQRLTRCEVEKCVAHLLKELNRMTYGAAFRRYHKKLFVVPSIEESMSGRLHVHLLIETPTYTTKYEQSFQATIATIWKQLRWALPEHDIRPLPSYEIRNWTEYILKDFIKNEEVVDFKNLYLGEDKKYP